MNRVTISIRDNKKRIMKIDELLNSKAFKIIFPLIAVVVAIILWRNGYQFGQWLYKILR